MDVAFNLSNAGVGELALVAIVAFAASILAGMSGFGVGLMLPVFLAPVVGITNIIPVMAVGMTLTNFSRVVAFWRDIGWPHVGRVLVLGLPACVAGAVFYTRLSAPVIAVAIGIFLIVSVPLRRLLRTRGHRLEPGGVTIAGAGWGFINGTMTGTGPVLISILMSAGVEGAALIGTDAIVSVVCGLAKIVTFSGLARLDGELMLAGLLIGFCTAPGAFIARWLLTVVPAKIHVGIMEVVVLIGGATFLWRGLSPP